MLPASPRTELLLVFLCVPAVEEKWCECVPTVQPSILPLPDTRVASQESQVTSCSLSEHLLIDASQEESSCFHWSWDSPGPFLRHGSWVTHRCGNPLVLIGIPAALLHCGPGSSAELHHPYSAPRPG